MSLLSTLFVGQSGLNAANIGVQTTAANVANAMTPGYTRRVVDQRVASPITARGGLLLGQGTQVGMVARNMDRLLGMRRIVEAGNAASSDTLASSLKTVESWFDESTTAGVRERVDDFFDALTAGTADPSDPAYRTAVTQAANQLADAFSRTAKGLEAAQGQFAASLGAELPSVNALLGEVANLNYEIKNKGGDRVAGDLADRRDQILRTLTEKIGISADLQADGQVTVLLGGNAIVSGNVARTLSFRQETPADPPVLAVSMGKSSSVPVTDAVGGQLGGLVDAWEHTQTYMDDLNTYVTGFATAFNTAHQAGFDAQGRPGLAVFSFSADRPAASLTVNAAVRADGATWAFAAGAAANAGDAGNLEALMNLEESAVFSGGTQTGAVFLSGLVSRVGAEIGNAQSLADRRSAILADLDALAAQMQGVDLDEEAARLELFRSSYEASAKVIQSSNNLLGSLLELV
jgi:flagellar hook-associated protein 1 FlgK